MVDNNISERYKMPYEARKAKAAYMKEWRKHNPGKQSEYQRNYWMHKARELQGKDDEK